MSDNGHLAWRNEQRRLSDLIPWEHNPRQLTERQAEQLEKSLHKFDLAQPFLIGPENDIYDGHQRQNVMELMSEFGGDSLVDVRVSSRELTEQERRELVVRLHENTGDWDFDVLPNLYDVDELIDFGMPEWKIEEFLPIDEPEPADAAPQIDRAEELCEEWGVELGQVWRLPSRTEGNEHRLICGDCLDYWEPAVQTLFYDPEWDAMIPPPAFDSALVFTDGYRLGDVIELFGRPTWLFTWDCVSSWYTPNRPLRRGKHALWFGDIEQYQFNGAHYGDAGEERTVYNTRGAYEFKPDRRGKHLSDVFSSPITRLHADSDHSHSKPADWVRMLIGNCTRGDVYDPFCGSGESIIACENLSRQCRAVEIEPDYVAVALQRYQDAFDITAEVYS